MKQLLFTLLLTIISLVLFSQKPSEREVLLSATSKLLLFHNSAQTIQNFYDYDVRDLDSKKQKELIMLPQILLCLNKDISIFLKDFPQSKQIKTLVSDYEAAQAILSAFKSKNSNFEEESLKRKLLITLLKMDLEDLVGCK